MPLAPLRSCEPVTPPIAPTPPSQPPLDSPSWRTALNPFAPLRRRMRRWWLARLPRTDTLTLTQRNVYILPTGAGWMLALTLLVLLIASINFQLNLGYLLTFLLAGSATVGIYIGHANLRGLTLHLRAPEPHFLGSSAALEVQLDNARTHACYGIALSAQAAEGSPLHWTWTDAPAQGLSTVRVAFEPTHRGVHPVPLITAETRYPLGSFRIWTYWRPAAQLLVYPRPETPAPPLPPGEPFGGATGHARTHGVGEFDGVRAYQRGDPLKLVVWKKAAKSLATGTDDLISRDAQQSQRNELWLDMASTALPTHEARLSRLTAWVLQADRLGLDYGLRLPGLQIPPATGLAHRLRCLEALALA